MVEESSRNMYKGYMNKAKGGRFEGGRVRVRVRTPNKNKFTVVAGDFSTPLPEKYRSSRQKIIKDIVELNKNIHQLEKN